MLFFRNDYGQGCIPEIMEYMNTTNGRSFTGYGMDEICQNAKEAIKKGEVVQLHLTSRMPEREICLIWDKNRPKSIAVRKLMDALQTANM